jgi:putative FmdB family regulatory protein
MPIYEFYCSSCNTIFNFLSRKIDTASCPGCPQCKRRLSREVSKFAVTGRAKEPSEDAADELPVDDARMERAMESLASEAESINEDDPRQAAQLMRKFSKMTGLEFGPGMETALNRLEAGEDPEQIEAEMGDSIENEEPFIMPGKGENAGRTRAPRRPPPRRDTTLHDM